MLAFLILGRFKICINYLEICSQQTLTCYGRDHLRGWTVPAGYFLHHKLRKSTSRGAVSTSCFRVRSKFLHETVIPSSLIHHILWTSGVLRNISLEYDAKNSFDPVLATVFIIPSENTREPLVFCCFQGCMELEF